MIVIKKYVALLLVFVMLLFAACSPAQSPESEPTTSTTAATEPNNTDVLTEPSEPNNVTELSEPSEEATQPSADTSAEPSDPTVEPTEPPTDTPSVPTEPTTKPSEPMTKPTQPTEPMTKPGTSGGNSSTDGTDDKEKPSQPTEPTTKPTVPSQPSTDDNDDTDIIEKPSQPTEPNEETIEKPTVPSGPAVTVTLKINTKNNTKMKVGETLQVDYTYTGTKTLTWNISDTSVATVSKSGVVTAKSAGLVGIEVTDGTLSKAIVIEVEETKPQSTSIKKDSFNAPLYDGVTKYAGDSMTFRAWTLPYESNRNITVTSSNNGVVSVSSYTESNKHYITLKFKSAGSTKITLKSADGAVTESYTITVKADYSCNPGSGLLTPEEFVKAYNGVVRANGMSTSGMPTGYLVWTVSPNNLTWSKVRKEAEGTVHSWWKIGYRTVVLTYEGIDENGNHIFYERGA